MTRFPRRAGGVAAAVVAAAVLSGCGAGLGANTTLGYDASVGSITVIGSMEADDILILDDGNVPELHAVLVNNGSASDTLISVSISGATAPTLPSGGVEVPPGHPVTIGPAGTVRVIIDGLTATVGQVVKVSFTFRDAGTTPAVSALVLSPSDLTAGG